MGVIADAGRNEEAARAARVHVVSAAIVREGWCTPGGKVEPGESEVDALRRELREELGVELAPWIRDPPVVFDVILDPPTVGRPVWVVCYRINYYDAFCKPKPRDGTAGIGWFGEEELRALTLTPSDHASREKLAAALLPGPLASVRTSGDAGHEATCARDHLMPGVCSAGEEASDAGR